MSNEVVGGTGNPYFILCGAEKSPNSFFDFDTAGIVASNATISREFVSDQVSGDYALKITATSADGKIAIPIELDAIAGDLNSKMYFSSLRVKESSALATFETYLCDEPDGTGNTTDEVLFNTFGIPMQYHYLASQGTWGNTDLYLIIQLPTSGSSIYLYFNSIREVSSHFAFTEEQQFNLVFEKIVRSTNIYEDGFIQEVIRGWRPSIQFSYEYLTQSEEVLRDDIAEAECIVCFPRVDCLFHIFAIWDGNYSREYVANKMVGHSGIIPLKSIHIYERKAQEAIYFVGAYGIEVYED